MNILFLINHAGKGGSEKYVYILAKDLIKTDKVYFIYNEVGPLVEKMQEIGVTVQKINMSNPFDFGAAKKISKFCQENDIDIIHTQFPRENYIAILAKRYNNKIKVVYTAHIIIKNNFVWKFTNNFMTKKNDAIISVCTKNKELLIENKFPKDKIHIIFNGVVHKNYTHNIKNSSIRKDINVSVDDFVFVCVTRFTEEKGTQFLLESVKLLKTLVEKPFKILLVGDGEQENQLKDYCTREQLDKEVLFLGYREDVEEILMGSDCFVNCSKSEALSFAILEAMNFSLPVIATKVGGNSDIVNAENGILIRYGSVVQMAKAMEKMMVNKEFYEMATVNANKTIKEKFDLNDILVQTKSLYKEI